MATIFVRLITVAEMPVINAFWPSMEPCFAAAAGRGAVLVGERRVGPTN